MAVITTADIGYRPDAGRPDPGLPARIWQVSEESTGDASGGENIIQVNLKAAGVGPGNLFSLERLAMRSNLDAETVGKVNLAGMEVFTPGNDVPQWRVTVLADPTGGLALMELKDANPRLFMGQGATAGTAGTMSLSFANTDTEVIRIVAMGYMWTPGSMNTVGGLRRPAQGFFSN